MENDQFIYKQSLPFQNILVGMELFYLEWPAKPDKKNIAAPGGKNPLYDKVVRNVG